jgi:hypothetical protein
LFWLFSTRQLVLAVLAVLYPAACSGCSLLDAQVNEAQVLDVRGDLHRRPVECPTQDELTENQARLVMKKWELYEGDASIKARVLADPRASDPEVLKKFTGTLEKHPEEHFGKNGKGWKNKHGKEQVGDFLARSGPLNKWTTEGSWKGHMGSAAFKAKKAAAGLEAGKRARDEELAAQPTLQRAAELFSPDRGAWDELMRKREKRWRTDEYRAQHGGQRKGFGVDDINAPSTTVMTDEASQPARIRDPKTNLTAVRIWMGLKQTVENGSYRRFY